MPQTIDLINFPCGEDVTQWPKLTCTQPGQLDLQDAGLRLPDSRDILFQDNGQLRSFDDTHRLVFDRTGGLLELHEAGAIRFLTGGPTPTERLRILATGQVGIGTATPTSPLHVTGDIRTDGALRVAGHVELSGNLTVGTGASLRFELGADQRLSLGSSGTFEIDTAETAGGRLLVTASGNVGIGTTSPVSTLQVKSLTAINEGVTGTGAWANLGSNAFFDGVWKRINTNIAGVNLHMNADGSGQEFRFWRIEANGQQARSIAVIGSGVSYINEGNVGIRTSSPAEPLEVNGRIKSGALTIGPWPANPNNYVFFGTNVLNQADAGNYALLQEAAGSRGITFLNSPASIQFRIRNVDKMVLANNGQLQILADSNPILFTAGWNAFPDPATNRAEISNDTGTYKTLMIVGNKSAGIGRRVSVWDRLEVNGPLVVQQRHTIKIGVPSGPYGNDGIRGEPNLWLDAASTVIIKSGFQTRGMDIAERFKTVEQVHAGHVVIFDEPTGAVRLCDCAYDSRVIGIASADPAFILGLDPEHTPIALCGRVPCQVDADIAPIEVGDLLTTSPTRGHAQKVLQPEKAIGAIIGKALGKLEAGQGTIPALVLLQ